MDFTQEWEVCLVAHAIRPVIVVAGKLIIVCIKREHHNAAEIIIFHVIGFALETSLVFIRDPFEAGRKEGRTGFCVVFDAHIEIAFLEPADFCVAGEAEYSHETIVFARCSDSRIKWIDEAEGMTISRQSNNYFRSIKTFWHPFIDGVIYIECRKKSDLVGARVKWRVEACERNEKSRMTYKLILISQTGENGIDLSYQHTAFLSSRNDSHKSSHWQNRHYR